MFGDPQKLLAILDGRYPNFSGSLSVEAKHREWMGVIDFNVHAKRARLLLNGNWATYAIVDGHVRMEWDAYAAESFSLEKGLLIHAPDASLASHPEIFKAAIVTAYYQEEPETIRRCIESVQNQTHSAEHILIADGHPQEWIDDMPVRHIRLDRAHGDYGNTPRGVGALLAISRGYDGIGFLDADNWLEVDHISTCIATANANPGVDYIIARWYLRRPDRTIIPFPDQPEHVDTNCFFFLQGSFHIIPHFSIMPKELASVGDRVFNAALRSAALKSVKNENTTVNYHCIWVSVYQALGERPPAEAKDSIDSEKIDTWLKNRTSLELEYVSRRSGVRFTSNV